MSLLAGIVGIILLYWLLGRRRRRRLAPGVAVKVCGKSGGVLVRLGVGPIRGVLPEGDDGSWELPICFNR